jgi:hypothetical protein
MILINRGPEPAGLAQVQAKKLVLAVGAVRQYGAPSDQLSKVLHGYAESTKNALHHAQHKKCAWCERRTDFSSAPVEHIRPKNGAWRNCPGKPRIEDKGHYWWLTWTWTNLVFSCVRCNDTGHKANYFPLVDGTAAILAPTPSEPLPAAAFDTNAESPLLIDPSDGVDPLDHIEWRPVNSKLPPRLWSWEPVGKSPQGAATIAILKLKELTDDVADHVKKVILPSIGWIHEHLDAGRLDEANALWRQLIEDTLSPSSELSGPSWNALEWLMPTTKRSQLGLSDPPRPGRGMSPSPGAGK